MCYVYVYCICVCAYIQARITRLFCTLYNFTHGMSISVVLCNRVKETKLIIIICKALPKKTLITNNIIKLKCYESESNV